MNSLDQWNEAMIADQMNLSTFFAVASPTTLASLIADVQQMGTGADSDQLRLERRATETLWALVGQDEAGELIRQAGPFAESH